MKSLLASSNKGFTLIEIMIAMAILATISLFTAQSMQSAIQDKHKIQNKIDRDAKLRSAMKVIKSDIEKAFHYNNFNLELLTELRREILQKKQNPQGQSPQGQDNQGGNPGPTDQDQEDNKPTVANILEDYLSSYKEEKDKTQFLGGEEEIHFTSLNHVRRFEDAQESNMMEVGYYLKNCRSILEDDKRSQCLWRRSTPFIDEKIDEGGGNAVLLENVKSLQFSYFNPDEEEWMDSWYSNDRGTAYTKGKFPLAIKVEIEVEIDGKQRKDQMVVAVAFPNNPEKKKPNTPGAGANPQQSGFGGGP